MFSQISIFRHLTLLLTSPTECMTDVKKSGWLTPVFATMAAIAVIVTMPWKSPDAMFHTLKLWSAAKVLEAFAMWAAGLPQGGRGSFADAARVAGFLSLVDAAAFFVLRMPTMLFLVLTTLPVLVFLAMKALHEYENDALAFRVTMSALFLFQILAVLVLTRLGVAWPETLSTLPALLR